MESPLVLALDTDDLEQALAWSRAAGEAAGMVKVGLELFGAAAVAVGTGSFVNPRAVVEVADGLGRHLAAGGVGSPAELAALFKAER